MFFDSVLRAGTGSMVALGEAMFAEALHAVVRSLVPRLYRFCARGVQHIPAQGPGLIVANHVSFVDSLVLGAALRRVPRFVMHAVWLRRLPFLRPLFDAVGVIPIASKKEAPKVFARAFDEIDDALARGELVVVFPEGKLTSDGEVGVFKRGVEHILARRPVPVVPVALRGMWGSMWSLAPRRQAAREGLRRRHVAVVVGQPLSPTTSAGEMREVVTDLKLGSPCHLRGHRPHQPCTL